MEFKNRLLAVASVDLRSLTLFRVAVSLACILNIVIYWPDAVEFLTDDGLYRRSDAIRENSDWSWSILFLSGNALLAHVFLGAFFLAAVALLFGYRTRLATIICWVCVVSLRQRGIMLASGADVQLSVLLFWAIFLPLGACFSIDSALNRTPISNHRHVSVATLAMLLQVAYLYFIGALLKTGESWTGTFDAVYYAVSMVEYTTPLAHFLAEQPGVARVLTVYVYFLELLGPIVLFSPFATERCRLFVFPLLMSLHVGFALFLSIGIFPLVSLSGLCVFVPGLFWERYLAWWNNRPSRREIALYYDRGCGFCRKTCLIFRELALPPGTTVEPAQEHELVGPVLERENSWVVRDHRGRWRTHWDAVAYVWRRSPLLWPLGALFAVPGFAELGRKLYRLIASERAGLGRFFDRWLPYRDQTVGGPALTVSLFLGAMLVAVLAWNLRYPDQIDLSYPSALRPPLQLTALTQRWSMYAPRPRKRSKWPVFVGELTNGRTVDARGMVKDEPSFERPKSGWDVHATFRWRKFFDRIRSERFEKRLAKYYCRRWDARYPEEPMQTVTFYMVTQDTPTPGQPFPAAERKRRYRYDCR